MGRYRIFGDSRSRNCYKAALILSLTGREYEWIETNVMTGDTRSVEFLAMNPNGKVPLMQLPDGRYLAESNAMLLHLAEGSPYLPAEAYVRAQVYQWLFFEQYSHEPFIAVARFIVKFACREKEEAERLVHLRKKGVEALSIMDHTLSGSPFLAGSELSIADIALYAYTHAAGDGGIDVSPFNGVQAWLRRVESAPGFLSMVQACR